MNAHCTVYIVDDDQAVRDSLSLILTVAGWQVQCFAGAEEFLQAYDGEGVGCLLLDVRMPGMSGLEMQKKLRERDVSLPIIFLSGHADVPTSVAAMRAGAVDFLEKPYQKDELLSRIEESVEVSNQMQAERMERHKVSERLERLTPREREVMALVIAGKSNKEIGRLLGTSHRTVDVQRAKMMEKMETNTPQELAALAVRFDLDL